MPDEQLHFMDMPFYETGRVKKKPLGEEDIGWSSTCCGRFGRTRSTRPAICPIRTARTASASTPCSPPASAARTTTGIADCEVWLYRGAWHEWGPHEIEMAVPLSPAEVDRKRIAIFKHESQKDRALFPGPDMREFWKRAEDRNRETAQLYDKLGLAEYEAIEGFVVWRGDDKVLW